VPTSAPLRATLSSRSPGNQELHQVFVRLSFCSSCYRRRTIAAGRKVARRASLEVKCIGDGKARKLCKFGAKVSQATEWHGANRGVHAPAFATALQRSRAGP
jgi:hypothetical protein